MTEKRPVGRPKTTGTTKKRDLRIGGIYDQAEEIVGKGKMPKLITQLLTEWLEKQKT